MTYLVDLVWPLPIATLLLGWLIGPVVMHSLNLIGSHQTVSEYVPEHAGKQGTPTMGGFIVLIALLPVMAIYASGGRAAPLILLLGFGAIGFLDDYVIGRIVKGKRGLGWIQKLAMQLLIAVVAVWALPDSFGTLQFLPPWASGAFAVLTILFFANAYNFADGMDGLAGLLGILISLTLAGLLALLGGSLAVLFLCMAIAFLPFLRFNWHPAKVFMGDVGALPLGAVLGLGVFAFLGQAGTVPLWAVLCSAALASGVMIAELVPVPIQIASVKLRKKRVFPSTPIHHAYQQAGHPELKIVLGFASAQAVFSVLALTTVWAAIAIGGAA